MEIGVSTASLFMRNDTRSALKLLNKLDARVVEIFLESFSEYDEGYIASLRTDLGDLKAHSLHTVTTQFEPQLFSDVSVQKKDAYFFMGKICRGAREIGAENYTLHGRARVKKFAKFNDFPAYIRHFNELCDTCEGYGVNICLENVEWAFYGVPGFFSKLKDECPKLRTCFDLKQARISGYSAEEYIAEMSGRINTVHLSDVDANGKMCLPGKGTVDFYKLFKMLDRAKFRGNMLIEVYTNDYNEPCEIAESLQFLRKIKSEVF